MVAVAVVAAVAILWRADIAHNAVNVRHAYMLPSHLCPCSCSLLHEHVPGFHFFSLFCVPPSFFVSCFYIFLKQKMGEDGRGTARNDRSAVQAGEVERLAGVPYPRLRQGRREV